MSGSIQRRGENSYLLTVSRGFDLDGKRIRKTRTVKASGKTEARELLAEFITEIRQGEYIAPSHTKLKDYVPIWRKERENRVSPATLETYNYVLNARILPRLGHLKLEDIKHIHITKYLDELKEKGLSSSTIMKNIEVLNSVFKLAVTNEIIKSNPVDKVAKPSITYKAGDVYNSDEIKRLFMLLNEEENKQMVLFIKMALVTGMRRGEMLALQWDDVDFAKNTIHVRHSLSYTKERGYFLTQPKTKNSVRKIAPPKKFMAELKKHIHKKKIERMEAKELWEGGKYKFVFSSDLGKPYHLDAPNRWWNRFHERIDKKLKERNEPPLKRIRLHDLRHTAATNLINKGANKHSISKRLGHSNIQTTLNIYGHYLEEADQKIADMLEEDYL